jgi:plastocyanin
MHNRLLLVLLGTLIALSPTSMADITGRIVMRATPEKLKKIADETLIFSAKGELKNVALFLKDTAQLHVAVPAAPAVLEQRASEYVPHVVTAMVGQGIEVRNKDDEPHRVQVWGLRNGRLLLPEQKKGEVVQINNATKVAETYMLSCKLDPRMEAWVVVTESPYAAVSQDDGSFTIDTKGLKDGKYVLVSWHERLGRTERQIELIDGKATADLRFAPPAEQ